MPQLLVGGLVAMGVSASVAGPIANVLFIGLSLALSILFRPKVPTPEAGRQPISQPIPNRIRVIGKRRSAGAHMLYHSHRGSTLHDVIAVCEGPVNEFSAFWLHDDKIKLVGNIVTGIEAEEGAFRYGGGKIHIYTRDGLPTETAYNPTNSPPFKQDLFDDDVWSDFHRGDGIASACILSSDDG